MVVCSCTPSRVLGAHPSIPLPARPPSSLQRRPTARDTPPPSPPSFPSLGSHFFTTSLPGQRCSVPFWLQTCSVQLSPSCVAPAQGRQKTCWLIHFPAHTKDREPSSHPPQHSPHAPWAHLHLSLSRALSSLLSNYYVHCTIPLGPRSLCLILMAGPCTLTD